MYLSRKSQRRLRAQLKIRRVQIHGYQIPEITMQTLPEFGSYMHELVILYRIKGAVDLGVDLLVVLSCTSA